MPDPRTIALHAAILRLEAERRIPLPPQTPAEKAAAHLRYANASLAGVLEARSFEFRHMLDGSAKYEASALANAAHQLGAAIRTLALGDRVAA
jgi:hypothetical protein